MNNKKRITTNSNKNKLLAHFIVKKHCLVVWPSNKNGLIISIINRSDLVYPF